MNYHADPFVCIRGVFPQLCQVGGLGLSGPGIDVKLKERKKERKKNQICLEFRQQSRNF
jgi:hypothetical protein